MTLNVNNLVGQTLGGYQLDRVLGTGGSGIVYLAHVVEHPEQQVALKLFIPPPQMNDHEQEQMRKRFLQEAQTLMHLHHPHIVAVQALGEYDALGGVYLVMPYLSGGTLVDRLEQGPLPLSDAMTYIQQLAGALDYAHEHQIVHRDIKPANVLFDEQDHIYLADFGSAKLLDTNMTTLTTANQIIGTPGYIAPEQMSDQPIGPAADVYGLGILAYHMITGRLPFEAATLMALFRQITLDEPASPRDLRPDLPAPAAAVIVRALAKAPEQRFPSAGAFAQALERGLQNKYMTPTPHSLVARFAAEGGGMMHPDAAPSSWIAIPDKRQPSRRTIAMIAAALLVTSVSVGLLFTHLGRPASAAKTASELTQIATTTQSMAATNVAQGATHPAGGSPPKNKATQVAIATQIALGTPFPTATNSPGSTQVPQPTSIPSPTIAPQPTKVPTPTRIPTATPIPGQLAFTPSGDTSTGTSLPPINSSVVHGCDDFSSANTTLYNVGRGSLSWSYSLTFQSSSNNGSDGVSFSPTFGTLAPGASVTITFSNGFLWQGDSATITFSGPNDITEYISC